MDAWKLVTGNPEHPTWSRSKWNSVTLSVPCGMLDRAPVYGRGLAHAFEAAVASLADEHFDSASWPVVPGTPLEGIADTTPVWGRSNRTWPSAWLPLQVSRWPGCGA